MTAHLNLEAGGVGIQGQIENMQLTEKSGSTKSRTIKKHGQLVRIWYMDFLRTPRPRFSVYGDYSSGHSGFGILP
jgi:hypothetical protein